MASSHSHEQLDSPAIVSSSPDVDRDVGRSLNSDQKTSESGPTEVGVDPESVYVVDWDGPDDPSNPKKFVAKFWPLLLCFADHRL